MNRITRITDKLMTIVLVILGIIHTFSLDSGGTDLVVLYFACANLFVHNLVESEEKDKEK